jgi:D-amino-acid dehydrogenase
VRAAGVAEVGGYDRSISRNGPDTVLASLRELFPQAAALASSQPWAGLRPMTPDGPPYLGKSPVANLFVNAGQGSNGWTQACGCGRIVADIVSGRTAEIDLEGFGVGR